MASEGLPTGEPDFSIALWMNTRTIVIDGRLQFTQDETIRLLRSLADRMERGGDFHMTGGDLS